MRWRSRIFGWVWMSGVILSALLFLAAVGMWGRSYWRRDFLQHTQTAPLDMKFFRFDSDGGHVRLGMTHFVASEPTPIYKLSRYTFPHGWHWGSLEPNPGYIEYSLFGFGFNPLSTTQESDYLKYSRWRVGIPYWFITVLCLPLPLIAFRRWRRKRRIEREKREGLCHVCGYDLRASVDRCPECGTGFAVPKGKHGEAEWPVKTRES